jgi:hypothetical protein
VLGSWIVEVNFDDFSLLVSSDLHVFFNEFSDCLSTVSAQVKVHREFIVRLFTRINHNLIR